MLRCTRRRTWETPFSSKKLRSAEEVVRAATRNENWGPTGTQLNELAAMTHQGQADIIFSVLRERIQEESSKWRKVYKGLQVIEFLCKRGAPCSIEHARMLVPIIHSLQGFQHRSHDTKDTGANVRIRSSALVCLLQDTEGLMAERAYFAKRVDAAQGPAEGSCAVSHDDVPPPGYEEQQDMPCCTGGASCTAIVPVRAVSSPQYTGGGSAQGTYKKIIKVPMTTEQVSEVCAALARVLMFEGNSHCADCGQAGEGCRPTWASTSCGTLLCIKCAGVHRSLGVHVSKVKSITMDKWTPGLVMEMERAGGNARANAYFEAQLPPNQPRPNDQEISRFIFNKYALKKWAQPDATWPPCTASADTVATDGHIVATTPMLLPDDAHGKAAEAAVAVDFIAAENGGAADTKGSMTGTIGGVAGTRSAAETGVTACGTGTGPADAGNTGMAGSSSSSSSSAAAAAAAGRTGSGAGKTAMVKSAVRIASMRELATAGRTGSAAAGMTGCVTGAAFQFAGRTGAGLVVEEGTGVEFEGVVLGSEVLAVAMGMAKQDQARTSNPAAQDNRHTRTEVDNLPKSSHEAVLRAANAGDITSAVLRSSSAAPVRLPSPPKAPPTPTQDPEPAPPALQPQPIAQFEDLLGWGTNGPLKEEPCTGLEVQLAMPPPVPLCVGSSPPPAPLTPASTKPGLWTYRPPFYTTDKWLAPPPLPLPPSFPPELPPPLPPLLLLPDIPEPPRPGQFLLGPSPPIPISAISDSCMGGSTPPPAIASSPTLESGLEELAACAPRLCKLSARAGAVPECSPAEAAQNTLPVPAALKPVTAIIGLSPGPLDPPLTPLNQAADSFSTLTKTATPASKSPPPASAAPTTMTALPPPPPSAGQVAFMMPALAVTAEPSLAPAAPTPSATAELSLAQTHARCAIMSPFQVAAAAAAAAAM